jgi:hypothetical protein
MRAQVFHKRYGFLFNELLPQEKKSIKEQLGKERSEGKRQAMQLQLQRIESQLNEQRQLSKKEALQKEVKVGCRRRLWPISGACRPGCGLGCVPGCLLLPSGWAQALRGHTSRRPSHASKGPSTRGAARRAAAQLPSLRGS